MSDFRPAGAGESQRGIRGRGARSVIPYVVSTVALAVSLLSVTGNIRRVDAQGSATTAQQRNALVTLQNAFTSIADEVEPAVVGIHARPQVREQRPPTRRGRPAPPQGDLEGPEDLFPNLPRSPFGDLFPDFPVPTPSVPTPPRTASGSGVIIRRAGNDFYILTNFHVVEDAGTITVSVPGIRDEVRARMVGKGDPKTDLAVLRVTLPGNQPANRVANLGESQSVKVGQWAIAIGNPLDLGQTLTVGVVSAVRPDIGRIGSSVADYRDMIQTDASINPGNSGGPLVDINGNVIGINTAIASPSRGSIGIGFAIPIDSAKEVADQLIQNGEVIRGWLGVSVTPNNRELSPRLAEFYGVKEGALVENVEPNTPASRAGLQPEDVITQWGDTRIRNFNDLERAVSTTPPGRRVPVRIVRDRREQTVTVTTEKRPPEEELQSRLGGETQPRERPGRTEAQPATTSALGVTVRGMTAQERSTFGVNGVVVTAIAPDSTASEDGLFVGDVITRVNQRAVGSLADFRTATSGLNARESVILRVVRRVNDRQMSTIIELRPSEG